MTIKYKSASWNATWHLMHFNHHGKWQEWILSNTRVVGMVLPTMAEDYVDYNPDFVGLNMLKSHIYRMHLFLQEMATLSK